MRDKKHKVVLRSKLRLLVPYATQQPADNRNDCRGELVEIPHKGHERPTAKAKLFGLDVIHCEYWPLVTVR